ncbi:MAG: hypothetical protein LBH15_01175 [Treponema sp.]|jgi:hypothetical protein|nr:hypothetical protein [Treponema sp.]
MARKNLQGVTPPLPGALSALLCALALLASCATSPPAAEPGAEGEFAALDGGGMAYFTLDVPGARPILDLVQFEEIRGGQMAEILDMTDAAAGAVYAAGDGDAGGPPGQEDAALAGRRYLIAARGKYPALRAGFAFTFSPEWKKLKSPAGKRYWYSGREGIALVLDARSALVSNTDPYPRSAAVEIPGAFREFRENAALAGWLCSPSVPLNRFTARLNIPIQIPADLLVFAVYPAGSAGESRLYNARLRLETQSPSQARALAAMFGLARLFAAGADLPPAIAALLANPPESDGAALVLSTGDLEPEAVALLFNMFSVYSK